MGNWRVLVSGMWVWCAIAGCDGDGDGDTSTQDSGDGGSAHDAGDGTRGDGGGEPGDDGGTADGGDADARPCSMEIPEHFVCLHGRFEAAGSVERAQVEVRVLGQPDSTTQSRAAGEFEVLLDTRRAPVSTFEEKAPEHRPERSSVVGDDYTVVSHQRAERFGNVTRTDLADLREQKQTGGDSRVVDLGALELLPTGSLSGTVRLAGASDHTGIRLYVPGTSYLATTAADGSFVMEDIPPGVYPFVRAESDGYLPILLPEVEIPVDDTLVLPELTLSADTGVRGALYFPGGDYATTREVEVRIDVAEDALLMQLSENSSFVGAEWTTVSSVERWTFNADGEHTLYVRFANANGLESSPESATLTIDTDPQVEVLAPSGTIDDSRPRLEWQASRIQGARYRVQVDTDPEFGAPLLDETVDATELTLPSPLTDGETYYVRVAIVADATTWNFGAAATFDLALGAVEPSGPIGATNSTLPTLSWPASSLPSVTYDVQLASDAGFVSVLESREQVEGTSVDVQTVLEAGATYHYRVRVVDQYGVAGPWSGASFTVDLGAVNLVSPLADTPESLPTLSWGASALSGATYEVELALDAGFTQIVDSAGELQATEYEVSSVLSGETTYHWRVRVIDVNDQAGAYAAGSFTVRVGTVASSCAALAQVPAVTDATPTLRWCAVDTADTYRVRYGTTADLTGATELTGVTSLEVTLADLGALDSQRFYWDVTVVDDNGVEGAPTSPRQFLIDVVPPEIEALLGEDGGPYPFTDVPYEVTATDGSGGSLSYALAADDLFTSPVTGQFTSGGVRTGTFAYDDQLDQEAAELPFWVRVTDPHGNEAVASYSISLRRFLLEANYAADTTVTDTSRPYVMYGNTNVLNDVTLTFGAGTTLLGRDGAELLVLGEARFLGTAVDRCRVEDVVVRPMGRATNTPQPVRVEVRYTDMIRSTPAHGGSSITGGSLVLTDSRIEQPPRLGIDQDEAGEGHYLARNVFVDTDTLIVVAATAAPVLENNLFHSRPLGYNTGQALVDLRCRFTAFAAVLSENSFLSLDQGYMLANSGDCAAATATQNYWGGRSDGEITEAILDSVDYPATRSPVTWDPPLASADPDTPTYP